ncbi:hypothetical protein SDC9_120032 [bioreactor metagenome]|uniref:Uncharacterized protein n=1 Tax=bioreactor metagenome TaxID=1076179 RepID=A0A645C5H7_9ZZZZ
MPESRQGAQHFYLHVPRQARAHALHVHLVCGAPFRLDEDLVPLLIRKANDLVLNARAVPRSGCVNQAAVHG